MPEKDMGQHRRPLTDHIVKEMGARLTTRETVMQEGTEPLLLNQIQMSL
jgi:hypothetical protein